MAGETWIEVRGHEDEKLRAIDGDFNHIPDAAMTIAVLALFADGPSTLRNIGSWRVKETDRIAAMARELAKLGAGVEEGEDWLRVIPPKVWRPAAIDTYDDHRMAERLKFYYLDSGAIYRAAALAAQQHGFDLDEAAAHEAEIAAIAGVMDLRFFGGAILLDGADVSLHVRSEACGHDASRIAVLPKVRAALLQRQRDFRDTPGLVADGRDMGSVVFPDATLKVFLTAGVEERARRRHAQLIAPRPPGESAEKGASAAPENAPKGLIEKENSGNISALFDTVLADLQARDERDSRRAVAPLAKLEEAKLLDTSHLSIEQAVESILGWYREVATPPEF
jgi:3-phosphoshikimate 1-carboxyvinyltransferase